jgi:hypothetical protein
MSPGPIRSRVPSGARRLGLIALLLVLAGAFAGEASGESFVVQDGGRYPVGSDLIGPCRFDPLPSFGFTGAKFRQYSTFSEIWDEGGRYSIRREPNACLPRPAWWYPEVTEVPTQPGAHTVAVTTYYLDYVYECPFYCVWKSRENVTLVGSYFFPIRTYDKYTIQLKAWIPSEYVVDPLRPAPIVGWLNPLGSSCLPWSRFVASSEISSVFRGDNHIKYEGSARAWSDKYFEWDGQAFANEHGVADTGETHLVITYRRKLGQFLLANSFTCELVGKARNYGKTSRSGYQFHITLSAADPLVPFGLAPPIDASLDATFSPDGSLAFYWLTDRYPSYGFRLIRNGSPVWTQVIMNASCVNPMQWQGAGHILLRLTDQTNQGTAQVLRDTPSLSLTNACS